MVEALQDSVNQNEFTEVVCLIMNKLLCTFGSHTFPNSQLNKSFIRVIGTQFQENIDDLVSQGGNKNEIVKFVLDSVFDSIHADLKDYQNIRVSPAGAKIALQLLNAMFKRHMNNLKGLSLTQNVELASTVLVHFLLVNEGQLDYSTIVRECQELVFDLIYSSDIITPNYKAFNNADLSNGRFVMLGYCLAHGQGDAKQITADMLTTLETTVLDDRLQRGKAEAMLAYYFQFLACLDKDTVESKILPQIQFIMNRTTTFVGVVALMFQGFKIYQIEDLETLKKWTTDLLPEDVATESEGQLAEDVVLYMKSLHAICSEAKGMKHTLTMGVLVQQFKESKRGQAQFKAKARAALLRQVLAIINSQKDKEVGHDLLRIVIEHFMSLKEESEVLNIAQTVYSFVSLALPQDVLEVLVPLLQKQGKVAFPRQIQIVLDQLQGEHDLAAVQQMETTVSDTFLASLLGEKFTSNQNSSTILALSAFFALKAKHLGDAASMSAIVNNESAARYLMSPAGFINSLGYIESKDKSLYDQQNHVIVIEGLLKYHFAVKSLEPRQLSCLLNNLCEILLNQNCVFRHKAVLSCFESLKSLGSQLTIPLFRSLFEKISEVRERPAPKLADNEFKNEQGHKASKKIQLVLKMLYDTPADSGQTGRAELLDKQEFFLLLRTICHPFVSSRNIDLMHTLRSLTEIMDKQAALNGDNREMALPSYFKKYFDELVQYALVQRTGILSRDPTLRAIAKNMLICLGWQGYLGDFIGKLVTILNYKPVELAVKLRAAIKREATVTGPYELMFYSEVTKDLNRLLVEKDLEIESKELRTGQQESASVAVQQEEQKADAKKAAPAEAAKALTPAQMQAAMMKQMAGAGKAKKGGAKAGAGGKGGAKGGKPAAAAAKPAQQAPKPAPAQEEAVDKETRRKMDTQQLLAFCDQLQTEKADQVAVVWDILRCVNQGKEASMLNYQDVTLKHTIMPAVRLLNYSCTRFSTFFFLQNLFKDNRHSPFYGIRIPLMSCLLCVQENRIYQRTVYDFQKFFQHIQQAADFSDMDAGYLQLILMLANFVLQSLEVNLSVKESALSVAQEILDTNMRVKNLDLVRLTINMMKSNYIGKNLSGYLQKLIRRLSTEELALMLQRLFEYDPTARQKFLAEILAQPEPLFCPVWFSTQMWIMQFDEEFYSLSRKIWNRYGLVLRSGALDIAQEHELGNIYHHLRSSNTGVFDMTVRAAIAAIEILQGKYDSIVDDLLKFYHSEIVTIRELNLEALRKTGDDNNFEGDKRFNRIALPQIVERTSKFVPHASVQKLLDFFIVTGSADSDPKVSRRCLEAAHAVVHARGRDYAAKMLEILERFVDAASDFQPESVSHAVVLIGALSSYLDKSGQKKLVQTFEKMLLLLARPVGKGASELVNRAICKCIPLLSRYFEEKTKQIFTEQLAILRSGKKESEIRGAAYACAGIIKGQGLKFFREKDIIGILQRECFTGKKVDPLRLQAGLQLYETLSFAQGKAFEPSLKELLPNIMTCISDAREPVRACANAANEQIVRNFSNHAIKLVVPMFLEGLQTDNWRGKFAAVEALGNMAHCAPKQISGFLPDIVTALREVLNDTHERVHEAAIKAVSKIGSVIKCPEVAELLDVIIAALGNSNVHLNACLGALLTTRFAHAIDAPSLSLLVPLVDVGLTMHDNSSKQMAAQLMGNICNLTQDPEDLLPYMKILIPAIKNSLFDSIPEIRASASKALGKLSKGLGLAHSIELLEWLNMHLNRKDLAPSERSGAAQGLSEVISSHGENFFANQCKELIALARSKETPLRESYRTVLAYLPTSYAAFVDYLLVLLPIMIEGLADDSEEVRKVSLRNVKICIQQYGKTASESLCKPILAMMFDKDARVRMSSSILMYQLVKEMENDVIKAQPKYINLQMKYAILSAMFVLKFDPIEKVQTQAAQIWKSLVDAPVHVLRMIIETLIRMVFDIIQSKHAELQDMGLACMRGLVEKFGERIVNESLDIFEGYLEQATDLTQTSGISRVILNMAGAASHRLLLTIKQRLTAIADPFLVNPDQQIRELSARVFTTIFKRLGESAYTQSTLDVAILQKLSTLLHAKGGEEDIANLVKAATFMLESCPELKLEESIMHLCGVPTHSAKKPLTTAQAVLLRVIAPTAAPLIYNKKFFNNLFSALELELTTDPLDPLDKSPERLDALLKCFAELVARVPEREYAQINEAIMDFHDKCAKRGTVALYIDLIAFYCTSTKSNYEKHAPFYTTNILRHMNADDKGTVEKVVPALSAIIARLPKENQFALVPLIRDAIERIAVAPVDQHLGPNIFRKKVKSIRMLDSKEGVKTLAGVIQNAIMHGSLRVRIDSAYCFKYLIDFATPAAIKTEVIKICGALIRVVNDKFTADLKVQIFLALRVMLVKAGAMVRAMVAQLQTTFLKAFADPLSTETVRQIVVDNLLLLIKIAPKADPIVKELTSQLDGGKLDGEQKEAVSQALALVLREKGKALQEAISKQTYSVLTRVVEENKHILNDKVLVNSSIALGFLSAFSSEPSQMKDLFNAYNASGDFRITLGIKLGVLMNNSAKLPEAASLRAEATSHITNLLSTRSGILEVDGKDIKAGRADEEIFRFDGALATLGHIMDTFQRRLYTSESPESKLVFQAVSDSKILQTLNAQEDFSGLVQLNKQQAAGGNQGGVNAISLGMSEVYWQIPSFIAQLPVPSLASKQPISAETAQVMRDSFTFIHKFYLDFDSKRDAQPALLNLLQLTYNNGHELSVSASAEEITPLTSTYIRDEVCEVATLHSIIPQDMKMICGDIIFATE